MKMARHFVRGTSCTNIGAAIEQRLDLRNISSTNRAELKRSYTPGVFFYPRNNSNQKLSEDWARNAAKKEKKSPLVIDLILTPENFPLIKSRVFRVEGTRFVRDYKYMQPKSFEDLGTGQICINLAGISHGTLEKLHVRIGVLKGNKFVYREYADLYNEYRTNREGGRVGSGVETGLY